MASTVIRLGNAAASKPATAQSSGKSRALVVTGGDRPTIAYDRLMLVMLLFAGAIFLISARLTQLQITSAGEGRTAAATQQARGDIVDRNNVVLARTIEAYAIGVQPNRIIGNKVELAAQLNELMPEQSAAWYLERLNGSAFQYLRRSAPPELVQAVNALGEPGIMLRQEPERLYPQGQLAPHILGFVGEDGGRAGVEFSQNGRLTTAGGQPVQLSIDSRVQGIVEDELGGAMQSMQAEGGTAIILDVDNGEILAMASAPDFNPNVPPAGQINGVDNLQLRNNATLGSYELGSTFKPLTVAAAIDAGVTRPAQRWDSSTVVIGSRHIRDSHPVGRDLTVPEILTHSSNTATSRIADQMGPARMRALWTSLHFNERMPVELRERAGTLMPGLQPDGLWSRGDTMSTGFGHAIAVTPLHLAAAYAALVNGGVWRPTTLLKLNGPAPEGQRVFSAETSHAMRQMLRLIVTNGTGRNADVPGMRLGGKTGTAEKSEAGHINRNKNVSTFIGAFPMDRPRYVILVMLDAPQRTEANQGQTTAAYTSAPVVRRILQRSGALLGVIPDTSRDIDLAGMRELVQGAQED